MKQPLLSILICTLPERSHKFDLLLAELYRQRGLLPKNIEVQILFDDADRGIITIGEKSDQLLKKAKGKYVFRIDDDDNVSRNYLQLIYEAALYNPDIITFDMDYYRDGVYEKTLVINNSGKNEWRSPRASREYNPTHRFTINEMFFHLCPVRKTIADQVGFISANSMEDVTYSNGVKELCKTDFHILHTLLYVNHSSTKTQNA